MAQRRCLEALTRGAIPLLSSPHQPHSLPTGSHLPAVFSPRSHPGIHLSRHFSPAPRDGESEEDEEDSEEEEDNDEESGPVKEHTAEAAAIGYSVVGPFQPDDRVFKRYEPVFAVGQIGSHQFKVSNGDSIFTERLKFCEAHDKIALNKVLVLGSSTQMIIGRLTVPDAVVLPVVEEHAMDAKVIIFKKKRRKNYRRTKGHRQELTQLRITDIQGIEKPKKIARARPKKETPVAKEKAVVAA